MIFLELYPADKKGPWKPSWWPPIRRHSCKTLAEAMKTADGHLEAHPDLVCIVMDEQGARKRM